MKIIGWVYLQSKEKKCKDTGISKLQRETKGRNLFDCLTSENCSDTGKIGLLMCQEGIINGFVTVYRVPLTQRFSSWTMAYDNLLCSPERNTGYKISHHDSYIFFNSYNLMKTYVTEKI